MKKIAVIHNLTSGGAVRVLTETNRLLSRKYCIKIFSPPKNIFRKKNIFQNIKDYLCYVYITLPNYYRRISREINEGEYHAAIIHPDTYLKAPFVLFYLTIKSVYILHEPPREFYEPLCFHAPFIRDKLFTILRIPVAILDIIATKKAAHIVVNSKFSKTKIDKIYGVEAKIIYPGVTSEVVKTGESIKRKYLCLSVGSLLPYKGHELTIEAIGLMSNKPELVVVGGGREVERKKLIKLAEKKEVALKIIDNITDGELNNLYRTAKVYVNSAYHEPFGLTSLEALYSGENLVTVDECGTQELKEFFGSRVSVVSRTTKSISKAIKNMLNGNNPIPRRPVVFSWGYFIKELSNIIEND